MADLFGNPRVVQLFIWLIPPVLALVGLLASGLTFAIIFAVIGLNLVLTAELLLRQTRRRFSAQILESERDIVDTAARMVADADLEHFYLWSSGYSDPKVDAVRRSEKVYLDSKRPEFRMRVLFNPHSANWTSAKVEEHRSLMRDLIASGKYAFAPTEAEGLELCYADYVDPGGSRQYRAYVNFMRPDRTPYVGIYFDTGTDPKHERVTQSIKTIFETEWARARPA